MFRIDRFQQPQSLKQAMLVCDSLCLFVCKNQMDMLWAYIEDSCQSGSDELSHHKVVQMKSLLSGADIRWFK